MTLNAGDIFAGRFTIDRLAGSGGMGTVYRALDQLSGEFIALKILHTQRADTGDGERFAREAQILSELRHPGIVAHVAHGQTLEGQRFLAMQWLDGEDLAQRLSRGPLSVSCALTLIARTAQALAFAHQHGVVHRDLKPTNLFLPHKDIERVQILDFGIARRLAASRALTRTGMIVGTPEYMAPEQACASHELTPAADLFSLGCILYECLAGTPPFVAEHIAAVLVRILFEEPVPILKRCPGVAIEVSELLDHLLTKDPAQRIGDASAVAAAVASMGKLANIPSLPPLGAAPRTTPRNLDSERVLLSLVLALSPRDNATGATELASDGESEFERHAGLVAELRRLGTQADLLVGGALVVAVPQLASAKDQATLAVRCATKIKEHWHEAQVAVVTGRGMRNRGGLTGDVLDRAWWLLSQRHASPEAAFAQLRIDEVSAGLLESRFDLTPVPGLAGAFALGSERLDPDTGRLLLGKPTPCVGRERELAMLEAIYRECKEDLLARAVLVLAPPGLGKSRLRHEFLRRLESHAERPIVLMGRGDPLKTQSAYGLLGEALRQRMELHAGADPAELRQRLRMRVSAALPAAEAPRVTVFIGELCGIPFPDEDSPLLRAARQDPRAMSDQVEQAWLDGLRLLHRDEPLLLVLEDLHWCDALTLKLVDAALRRLRDHSLMVLALARPEVHDLYPNLWAGAVQPLPLHPLARKAGERLVRQILPSNVGPEQVERIVAQSAGNPLFLEELIRATAERKTGDLPETVAAMIQTRIGRLPVSTRRALRAASVFGETFWESGVHGLLASTHGNDDIRGAITELIREEIIEKTPERRFANEVQYRFRHALVRDSAYGLVSADEKIAWHAAAGAFLEALSEPEAVVLAEHFRLGQELPRAVACYTRATEQTYAAGDFDAALDASQRGVSCGAKGDERALLLSVRLIIHFWRAQFQEILDTAPEALSVLQPGSKPWCRAIYALFPAAQAFRRDLLPDLIGRFLAAEPQPAARSTYVDAAAMLTTIFLITGQVQGATQFRHRIRQVVQALPIHDPCWAWFHYMEAYYYRHGVGLPFSSVKCMHEAVQIMQDAGLRQFLIASRPNEALYMSELGQQAAALQVLRDNLDAAKQIKDEVPVRQAEVWAARQLAKSPDANDLRQAEQLARRVTLSMVPVFPGVAHGILAQLAHQRGALEIAEAEARAAIEALRPYPPYRVDAVAIWAQALTAQGKYAEAMQRCEEIDRELLSLGIEPYGLVTLLVALAEARSNAELPDAARQTVERAIALLRRRIIDIPDLPTRAGYLRGVPENARLLELGTRWGLDISDLIQIASA